jgi:SAM-dependent methyltransferase
MSEPIRFEDDDDHLINGVLRLLALSREELDSWIRLSSQLEGPLEARLAAGWAQMRPAPVAAPGTAAGEVGPGPGGRAGRLWHEAIAETPSVGFASDGRWAWLVRWDGTRWARVTDPPVYEQEYFEGGRDAGGYTAYREQAGWRLEKAHRQVREMRDATGLSSGRVLDVGSGYGYFRVALDKAGFEHEGLEVSDHGRTVARKAFGQRTHPGFLEDHWEEWSERFDVVTGFDLIEHVPDPVEFLQKVAFVLRPGGFVGLKTPNLDSPEADIFGPHYHSLKREHLVLFSPDSLTEAAGQAGLEPVSVKTVSHLLRGFVGDAGCRDYEAARRGADIVGWYRLPR